MPKKSKKISELAEAENAVMESDLIGALWEHLTKKGEEIEATLQHLESSNPTLHGYVCGFKHGLELSREIVSAASNSVGVGQHFIDHRSWEIYPEYFEKLQKQVKQ